MNFASNNPSLNHGNFRTNEHQQLLSPTRAWRILYLRTGGRVSRSTFYRWLDSGRVYSLRIGTRMYIPWRTLQESIAKCFQGEPF